jgi:predicted metal-dependent phosphoesterase TrpH
MAANLAPGSTLETPAAQDVTALRQVFASVTPESCPHAYNFHMHTTHSDGKLEPESLVEQAIALSLTGFSITDHHQITGFRIAQRHLQEWQRTSNQPVPQLWTGTEITAQLLETEVHILGFAFDPDHAEIRSYFQGCAPQGERAIAAHVVSAIHEAGGIAVLAHPARYRRSADELIPAAAMIGIDGVETYYAYNNPKPWQPSPNETQNVRELSEKYHLLNTCGTDTHGMNLLQRL